MEKTEERIRKVEQWAFLILNNIEKIVWKKEQHSGTCGVTAKDLPFVSLKSQKK
jgi:hypothetical protein